MSFGPTAPVRATSIAGARQWFDPDGHYLNTAAVGLPPQAVTDAMTDGMRFWRTGETGAADYDAWVEGSRRAFAEIVGTDPTTVAVGHQVSACVGVVAASLPDGAEVLCPDGEFTSLIFPFLVQEPRIAVRTVPLEELAGAIKPTTSVVAFSLVQSADGRIADTGNVLRAARDAGALTLADATQACGWLPVRAPDFDILVAAAYKWLLAPRGTAFTVVRPERLEAITPTLAGWYAGGHPWESIYGTPLRLADDARRLDVSPAWLSWVGTLPALQTILAVGVEAIHRHDLELANRFREGLGEPPGDSAIVALSADEAAPQRLASRGVRSSWRAGKLRVSFHLYNDEADVDAAVEALASP